MKRAHVYEQNDGDLYSLLNLAIGEGMRGEPLAENSLIIEATPFFIGFLGHTRCFQSDIREALKLEKTLDFLFIPEANPPADC
jgi:hypothetical protein